MRSVIKRILVIALAAGIIACVGTGCAKNDNKAQESSTVSAQSTDTSVESKASEASKEESKDASAESKTESSEQASAVSEASVESTQPSEETTETSAADASDVAGTYVFGAGGELSAELTLNPDMTVAIVNGDGSKLDGTWTLEGTVVSVITDDTQLFDYKDDKLYSKENSVVVFVRKTSPSEENPTLEDQFVPTVEEVAGYYVFGAGENVLAAMTLDEDGKITLTNSEGNSIIGTWSLEGSVVSVVSDDTQLFDYEDNKLYSQENSSYVFVKQAAPEYSTVEEIAGTYVYGVGADILATIVLKSDGSVTLINSEDQKIEGVWTVEDSVVTIQTDDIQRFDYSNNTLTSKDVEGYGFVRTTAD